MINKFVLVCMKSYIEIPLKIARKYGWSCNAKDGVGYENIDFLVFGQTSFIIESYIIIHVYFFITLH